MVFVKVRETYDLHTKKGKLGIIGIHTPKADIIKRNYPGLLMQCKAYRPVKCDVKLAAAATLPLDPLGVGLTENDVAPEDVFNPILYKALSNFGMSQIDAYVATGAYTDRGDMANYNGSGFHSDPNDDFNLYYGLLSQTHSWKHAHPQQGLMMNDLYPLVYEVYQNIGDNNMNATVGSPQGSANTQPIIDYNDTVNQLVVQQFRGASKKMPFLNCTYPVPVAGKDGDAAVDEDVRSNPNVDTRSSGFYASSYFNAQLGVPAPQVYVAAIIIPPSRLHELFFRMVVEWTLEFSTIRPLADLMKFSDLETLGSATHIQNYDYSVSKATDDSVLTETSCMVDTSDEMGIKKVM